jgi:hypothetical protein
MYGSDCCSPCPTIQTTDIPGTAGLDGADGAAGADGLSAYTYVEGAQTLANDLLVAQGIVVIDGNWAAVGECVVIDGPIHCRVTAKAATVLTLLPLGYAGDAVLPAALIDGALISPSGFNGPNASVTALTPEAAVVASPGAFHLNTADSSLWIKETGTQTNTGWIKLIGMILFLCSLLGLQAAAPPILRSSLTTNTEVVGLTLVTNIARTTATNATTILPLITNIVINVSSNNTAAMGAATNVNVLTLHTNIIVNVGTNNTVALGIATNAAFALFSTNRIASTMTNSFPLATNKLGLTAVFHIVDALDATTNQLWYTNGILYITNRYVF